MELTFKRAGELLADPDIRQAIVDGTPHTGLARIGRGNAQAALTEENILIITGSDSWRDYTRYNLRPNRFVPVSEGRRRIAEAIPYAEFHQGFLLHACEVLDFLGDDRPDFIVGHSLGAASAQIVGTVLGIPTIAFAPPQVIRRRYLGQAGLREGHAQWNVFNVAWSADFVTQGYRFAGLRCLGHRAVVDFKGGNKTIQHFAADYLKLLSADAESAERQVPETWFDATVPIPPLA